MRVFIAYAINDHTKLRLNKIQEQLKPIYPDGKFKPPKNMHMTLKFIGEVSVEQCERLSTEVETLINRYKSLTVELNQLGVFGNTSRNHTLWIGCQQDPSMVELSKELAECATAAGISISNTPFVPHITLAQHGTLCQPLPEIHGLVTRFDQVCIFLSSRIEGELVYQPLRCWQLK